MLLERYLTAYRGLLTPTRHLTRATHADCGVWQWCMGQVKTPPHNPPTWRVIEGGGALDRPAPPRRLPALPQHLSWQGRIKACRREEKRKKNARLSTDYPNLLLPRPRELTSKTAELRMRHLHPPPRARLLPLTWSKRGLNHIYLMSRFRHTCNTFPCRKWLCKFLHFTAYLLHDQQKINPSKKTCYV